MTPARYIVLLLLVSFFAVLGVAQQAQGIHLGRQVAEMEAQRNRLVCENQRLFCEISTLTRPARIAEQVGRLNIPLLDPTALTKAPLTEGTGDGEGPKGSKDTRDPKKSTRPGR